MANEDPQEKASVDERLDELEIATTAQETRLLTLIQNFQESRRELVGDVPEGRRKPTWFDKLFAWVLAPSTVNLDDRRSLVRLRRNRAAIFALVRSLLVTTVTVSAGAGGLAVIFFGVLNAWEMQAQTAAMHQANQQQLTDSQTIERSRLRSLAMGFSPCDSPSSTCPSPRERAQYARALVELASLPPKPLPVDLSRGMFFGADFDLQQLPNVLLDEADLRSADLRGLDFAKTSLRGARLGWADLRGANLASSDVSHATFNGACADESTRWPSDHEPEGVVQMAPGQACCRCCVALVLGYQTAVMLKERSPDSLLGPLFSTIPFDPRMRDYARPADASNSSGDALALLFYGRLHSSFAITLDDAARLRAWTDRDDEEDSPSPEERDRLEQTSLTSVLEIAGRVERLMDYAGVAERHAYEVGLALHHATTTSVQSDRERWLRFMGVSGVSESSASAICEATFREHGCGGPEPEAGGESAAQELADFDCQML